MALALTMCAALGSCGKDSDSSSSKAKSDSSAAATTAAEDGGSDSAATTGAEDGSDTPAPAADDTPSGKLLAEYPVNDGAYDVSQGASENMLGRSLLNKGDTSRLAAKFQYSLDHPKEIMNVVFLGDSITAGSGSSNGMAYVKQMEDWLVDTFGFYVMVTNQGIGATDSYCAVHRASRDVFELDTGDPDIIVIEFINDLDNDFYASVMDSLVRDCLSLESNPAVILLEPSCDDGSSPQNAHLAVAQAYDIPFISYHDAIYPEIEAGNFKWSDISGDTVHPNNAGHTIMAQCIINLFQSTLDEMDSMSEEEKTAKPFDESIEAPFGAPFTGAVLGEQSSTDIVKVVDAGPFTSTANFQSFLDGWKCSETGTATFEITAKNIGMLYMKRVGGSQAKLSVKVDGGDAVIIDGTFPGGWGDFAKADPIYESDEVATHTVTVEIIEGDGTQFEILSWLIS